MTLLTDAGDLTLILSVKIGQEQDLVAARRRARQLSNLFGFSPQDQTRIATAVSEIARNAYQYAGGGRLDFSANLRSRPQLLCVQVSDSGPGIRDLDAALSGAYVSSTGMGIGLAGCSRLMDQFDVSSTNRGTIVRFCKNIPARSKPIEIANVSQFCAAILQQQNTGINDEFERQNHEILLTLETLRQRDAELERRERDLARLNLELEETNRGVVALYAELDEKAAALRQAAEMKSRFLSHASHEFRTPVNSVLALTRMLLQRKDGELAPEQEKQVSYIRDAAQQLADLVNDLLDLAKVESGKTELQLTSINLSQFFGGLRVIMRPLATQDAVALVFEEPASTLVIYSDEGKLAQILRNLISNALKFTQAGEVRIAAGLSGDGDFVEFRVKDTGIGIKPGDLDRIFQEFAQVQHPLQTKVKGTGLGLSLSRSLAHLLEGTLTVDSTPGLGSTFLLRLPYVIPPDLPNEPDFSANTILVVDDELPSRYLAHQLFRGTTRSIVESSGLEALERARFENPVLILLDLVMPDRSGFEVLDDLKSDDRTRHIPVVIHTSKVLTTQDHNRLAGRQAAILPKGQDGRLPALQTIRALLREPGLFSDEPEFNSLSNG